MMRPHLARSILQSNPGPRALRPFLVALLALFAIPATAQACAMYVPEEVELMVLADEPVGLDELFALIDGESETTEARRETLAAMIQAGPLAGPDAALRELSEAMGTPSFMHQAVLGSEPQPAEPQS